MPSLLLSICHFALKALANVACRCLPLPVALPCVALVASIYRDRRLPLLCFQGTNLSILKLLGALKDQRRQWTLERARVLDLEHELQVPESPHPESKLCPPLPLIRGPRTTCTPSA